MKNKSIVSTFIYALLIAAISISCYFKPQTSFSESERRLLAQKPKFSMNSVFSGDYAKEFEKYSADQFPLREKMRSIKAMFATYIMNKKDNNGLFIADGHISKLDYKINQNMLEHAKNRFDYIYETYLKNKDISVYLTIVPDKNYFIAKKNGYAAIDYEKFTQDFKSRVEYMNYIDIFPLLSANDYYNTDSHWKQEEIIDIAELIAKNMGTDVETTYDVNTLDNPFKGVYLGQSAMPFKSDTIKYLTNDSLRECIVRYYNGTTGEKGDMYDMKKAYGKDPYEMFLSGSSALIEIENKNAKTDKELILFRDSFGSSIAPLFAQGYRKITVVDIRYVESSYLGNFIEFDDQDVLFLYSTTLLNNSLAMR